MSPASPPLRLAIAGATTLLGKEVAALAEKHFPAAEVRLLDDAVAEGVLTEAGDEPMVIQGASEESFDGCRFAFFTGSRDFTARHWRQAVSAGATLIDLSRGLPPDAGAVAWIPALRGKLAPPQAPSSKVKVYSSPPPPAIIACTLAAALKAARVERLAIVFFQPVSERGQDGIHELENQTVSLLSLKPVTQELYGAQVAFNLLARYGDAGGAESLADVRAEMVAAVASYLNGRVHAPSIQVVQAPVFHGYAFSALADGACPCDPAALEHALREVGIMVAGAASDSPTNVSVAGESQIAVGPVERDASSETAAWIWGAADNLRLSAANALSMAETLLAS